MPFAGVPQNIGQEHLAAAKGQAAGTLYVAPDGDVLLLHRARDGGNWMGHWALPGGGVNEGETPETAADRESAEELGGVAPRGSRKVLDRVRTPNDMVFHTFVQPVPEKFTPRLNNEHTGFCWAPLDVLPQPMHPAVRATIDSRLGITADMTPEDWTGLRDGFLKWLSEEEAEPEHATDSVLLAYDRMPVMAGSPERFGLAFDRASVRDKDVNGHLHIAVTNISKAGVNPYLGREIPGWKQLGLEPERIYQLLRHPDELARAAPTFNNLSVLSEHIAVTANDFPNHLVAGSTGTDAEFSAPYLRNSLVIWTRGGIEGVESEAKKELSSAYRYRADMTPGVWEGKNYDGVMRDIVGNHVALVKEGRAGEDVVVGDSREGINMAHKPIIITRKAAYILGGLIPLLRPNLALDAKPNFYQVVAGLTAKNYKEKRKEVAAAIVKACEPHLAQDRKVGLDEVEKVMDLLDKYEDPAEKGTKNATETDPSSGLPTPPPKTMDADPMAGIIEFLTGKLSPEDLAQVQAMVGAGATDEPPPFPGKPKPGGAHDEKDDDDKDDDKDKKDFIDMAKDAKMVSRPAMDAAIKAASEAATTNALKRAGEIRDAERLVRPYVGELAMSFDSAEAVLRHTLKSLGVKGHDTLHTDALRSVLEVQPVPNARKPSAPSHLAMDAGAAKSFAERFPNTQRIGVG